MKLEIFQCQCCKLHNLTLNGNLVLKTSEEGIAKRYARVFTEVSNAGVREGMQALTRDIGYCEETAFEVYNVIHGLEKHGGVQ